MPPDAPGAPAPVSSPTSMARASSATMLSSLVVTASSLNFRAFHHSERRGANKQVLARGTNLARAPPLFVQDFAIKRVPRAPFVQDFAIRRALNRQPALGGSLYRKILHKFKASRIQQKEQKEIRPAKKGSSRPEQRIVLHPLELSLTASRKVPAAYGRQAHNLERRRGREGSRLVQRRLRKENAAGGICLPGVATFDGHPHEQPCASDASFPHGRIPYREEPCIPSHSETGNSSS